MTKLILFLCVFLWSPAEAANRHHPARVPGHPAAPETREIRGTCTVMASAADPFEGPCVDMPLSLQDEQGKEITRVRSDGQGKFLFVVESGEKFRVVPSSSRFESVEPAHPFPAGRAVELKIRRRKAGSALLR